MKRTIYLAAMTLAWCAFASAQTASFQGIGRSDEKNPLEARQAACEFAVRNAVEKAADAAVPNPSNRTMMDAVLDGYKRYAKATQTVDEGASDSGYRCRVAVTVDVRLLTEDLKQSGVSVARAIGPKVMVIIDEYHFETEPPVADDTPKVKTELDVSASRKQELTAERSSARAAAIGPYSAAAMRGSSASLHASDEREFTLRFREYFPPTPPVSSGYALPEFLKALRERDYYVIDKQIADEVRATRIGVMADFMAKPSEIANLAKELGSKHNARWLVLGGVRVIGGDVTGVSHTARAAMMIRVVDTSTGEIVAASAIPSKAVEETTRSAAMQVAAVKITDAVALDVLSQVGTYESRRNALGQRLSVKLFSVPNARVVAEFTTLLKAISGVTEVNEANFDRMNGLLELDVAFQGKSEDLRNSILVASGNVASLRTLDLYQSSGGALDFALKPTQTNGNGRNSNSGRK